MNKPALGRGLKALINSRPPVRKNEETTAAIDRPAERTAVGGIPLDKIEVNPHQPRHDFDPQQMEELVESIRQHGIIQPLVVSRVGADRYQLITGERRWRAAKVLNLPTVPAIVRPVEEQEKLELALIENIQRQDLNAIEEARGYQRLIDEFGLTVEKAAQKVGKQRPTVSNALRLLRLPEEIQLAISSNKITVSHGKAIAALNDSQEQIQLFHKIVQGKLNINDANRAAREIVIKKHIRTIKTDHEVLAKEESLRNKLGTKVRIAKRAGRGQIIIEFFSDEELNEIVKKIMGKL